MPQSHDGDGECRLRSGLSHYFCFIELSYGMARSMRVLPPDSPWSDPAVVLEGDQLEQVDKLRRDLAACESVTEKTIICQRTRDHLLGKHQSLEILFAVCRDVMEDSEQSYLVGAPDGSWQQFSHLADKGARTRATCIKALRDVADRWGSEVIHHYGWGTMGLGYCQQLRAAARKVTWPTFVKMLNPVLLDRYNSRSLRLAPIPTFVNPIARTDIERVTSQLQRVKVRAANKEHDAGHKAAKVGSEYWHLVANRLPAGLGLDRFGVLVMEKFAERPESLETDNAVAVLCSVQRQSRGMLALPAVASFASDRSAAGCTGPFLAEATRRSLPDQLPANITAAGEEALPLPLSPQSSPFSPPSNGIYCTRGSLAYSDQATKRRRTHPDLPWPGGALPPSPTLSAESAQVWSGSSALSDAREILGKSIVPPKYPWRTNKSKRYWPSSNLWAHLW